MSTITDILVRRFEEKKTGFQTHKIKLTILPEMDCWLNALTYFTVCLDQKSRVWFCSSLSLRLCKPRVVILCHWLVIHVVLLEYCLDGWWLDKPQRLWSSCSILYSYIKPTPITTTCNIITLPKCNSVCQSLFFFNQIQSHVRLSSTFMYMLFYL